jgi:hypothetical protein
LADDDQLKHLVIIDCRKTRNARDEQLKTNPQLKRLGSSAAQRGRIFGTEDGFEADYSRVTRGSLIKFAKAINREWQEFEADITLTEYKKWFKQWKAKKKALKEEKAPGASSKQKDEVEALHEQLRGYYELYHHATGKRLAPAISVSLIRIGGIDLDRSAVRCEVYHSNLHLNGHISLKLGFLYWELAAASLGAVCYGISYNPKIIDKDPGWTIRGIFLTISGDNNFDYPVATKGAVRFLGEKAAEAAKNSIIDFSKHSGDFEDLLQKKVGGYLSDRLDSEQLNSNIVNEVKDKILPIISNMISKESDPLALMMPR